MIARAGALLSRLAARFVPDPFVLALALTLLAALVSAFTLLWAGAPLEPLGEAWLTGLTSPGGLQFALQMSLILVSGHAIASSAIVRAGIIRLARVPNTTASAAVVVAGFSCVTALVHWGLGVVAGALLAREVGRHNRRVGRSIHYPVLGAAAYSGMAIWHAGFSGSAPLKVAEGDIPGLNLELAEILLAPLNVAVVVTLLMTIPALFYLMAPKTDIPYTGDLEDAGSKVEDDGEFRLVRWLHHSAWPGMVVAGGALALLFVSLTGERKLDLNSVILVFLFLGLLVQGSFRRYTDVIAEAARGTGAIMIQFPLYFGILALLKAGGLVGAMSGKLTAVSSTQSFPITTFASAGLVNLAIPSGGGQWKVQGQLVLDAGERLGVDPITTILAFSYGDAWSNMLQPFWALPLLAITGLKASEIIGYTAMVFLLVAAIVPALLFVFA